MTTTAYRPLVLLWTNEPDPYRQAVEQEGRRRISKTLAGGALGILGLGAIGQELARKASALERFMAGRAQRETVDRSPGY